jgi:hypothetical protein
MLSSLDITMPLNDIAGASIASGVSQERFAVVNPLAERDWDSQVRQLPGATFFHETAWLRVLSDTYGFTPVCLVGYNHNQLNALLPMVEVNSMLTGRRGVALPFADYCPPLAEPPTDAQALIAQALTLGTKRNWRTIEWRGDAHSPITDHRSPSSNQEPSTKNEELPSPTLAFSVQPLALPPALSFLTHTLDLTPGAEHLFNRFQSAVRRAIRKAESLKLEVRISTSLPSMEVFHQLYCLTRQRHGLPPQPFSFFRAIYQHIIARGLGFIAEAYQDGKAIASNVFFTTGTQALYKYGASDFTAQELRANNLVMWAAIKHLIAQKFTNLHFGRTSLANDGLRRFKNGWATEEQQLHYYRYDFRQCVYTTASDDAHGWHTRIFQHLPISLSRLAGALLYRHMA